MADFTRTEMKTLRQTAGVAYDRELARELAKLQAEFVAWNAGKIDAHELSDRVHRFHNGPARDLWVFYTNSRPDSAAARAIAVGLVSEDEVPPEIRGKLAALVEFYRGREETGEGVD